MPTDRQKKSRERNHNIMRLRGAYQLFRGLQYHENINIRKIAKAACMVIDSILSEMGAEPEDIRRERINKELLERYP